MAAPKKTNKKTSKKPPTKPHATKPSSAENKQTKKERLAAYTGKGRDVGRDDRLWFAIASAWALRTLRNWTENPAGEGAETVGDAARYHAARLDNTSAPKGRATKPQSFTTWIDFVAGLIRELDDDFVKRAEPNSLMQVSPYHLEVITDTSHPLYDRRVAEAIDPELLASIQRFHGPHTPPQAVPWGDAKGTILAVTDGRRRVLHTRAANEKTAVAAYLADGSHKDPLIRTIQIVVKGRDLKAAVTLSGAANFNRRDEAPMTTARKLEAEGSYTGASLTEMAERRGITRQTVSNYISLLKLAEPLQALMDTGELPFKTGLLLAGADHATQILALKKTADIPKWSVRTRAIKAHLEGVPWKPETASHRPPTPKQVRAAVEALGAQKGNPDAETGLLYLRAFMLGDPEAMEALPETVRKSFAGPIVEITGSLEQPCPKCKATAGQPCLTAASDKSSQWTTDAFKNNVHKARQKLYERELSLIPAADRITEDDEWPPAMRVICPKCNAGHGEYCLSDETDDEEWATQENTRIHPARLALADQKAEAA